MTLRSIQNEVIHLMEIDKFDENRRNGVIISIDQFLKSKRYVDIVSAAIKNQNSTNVISISTIPAIVNIVVSCIQGISLKNIQTKDMKYLIYGIVYSFIVSEDAEFFQDISVETFERLYLGIFDVLLIAPTAIEVSTTVCNLLCA